MRRLAACRAACFGTLTHLAPSSSTPVPRMVSVAAKPPSTRTAVAEALVRLPASAALPPPPWHTSPAMRAALFSTCVTAGVLAAKQTSRLIPMCHGLDLASCDIVIEEEEEAKAAGDDAGRALRVRCTAVASQAATGVEMEALVGASIASLTLYDMMKSFAKGIVVEQIRLVSKTGGKSGAWASIEK